MAVTGIGYRKDLKLAVDHRSHGSKVEYSNYTTIYSRAAKARSYSRRLQEVGELAASDNGIRSQTISVTDCQATV